MTVTATWTLRRNQKVFVKVVVAPRCHWNSCWVHLVGLAVNINHESFCPHPLPVHLERSPKGNSITLFFHCSRGCAHLLLTHVELQLSHHFQHCWCDQDILKLKGRTVPPGRRKIVLTQLKPKLSWHWWSSYNTPWESQIELRTFLPLPVHC